MSKKITEIFQLVPTVAMPTAGKLCLPPCEEKKSDTIQAPGVWAELEPIHSHHIFGPPGYPFIQLWLVVLVRLSLDWLLEGVFLAYPTLGFGKGIGFRGPLLDFE